MESLSVATGPVLDRLFAGLGSLGASEISTVSNSRLTALGTWPVEFRYVASVGGQYSLKTMITPYVPDAFGPLLAKLNTAKYAYFIGDIYSSAPINSLTIVNVNGVDVGTRDLSDGANAIQGSVHHGIARDALLTSILTPGKATFSFVGFIITVNV